MNIGVFFDYIEQGKLAQVPESAYDLCSILFQHKQDFYMPMFEGEFDYEDTPKSKEKAVVIAFSGGLKSIATAFFYKNMGYDIYLYHWYENSFLEKTVIQLAEKLEAPHFLVERSGWENFKDSPLGYMRLANSCLSYAINNTLPPNIAFGCYSNCDINSNRFDLYGKDTMQMWSAYEKIISDAIKNDFKVRRPYPQASFMWEEMLRHPSYLDLADTDKSMLYIVKADHGLIENVPKSAYMRSLSNIRHDYEENTGQALDDNLALWKQCFFYDMRKSRFYESLR